MHEMGLAIEILRTCREAVKDHGPGRLEWVKIAVGELAAVEPNLLSFAWEALTAESEDAGSRLDIEWRPAHQYCPPCKEEKRGSETSWLRVCPDCGSPLRVEGGDELDVLQVSFVPFEAGGGEVPA